ncbi:MAG: hypothetical protein R6V10_11185 [bacterium]
MQRKRALPTLVFTAAMLAVFLVSCRQPEMDDSIEPHESYFDKMVINGEKNVSIKDAVAHYLDKKVDPAGLTNSSVYLRVVGGSTVLGTVDGFEFKDCTVAPVTGCPLGVSFLSGGGPICDLAPETDYELVIDNLVLADGSTLSKTVTFTTGPTPAGYTPSPCPFLISGNTLDPAQGISGNLVGATYELDIVAAGIETGPPYNDYRNLTAPSYIAILEFYSGPMLPFDLSTTVQWVNLKVNGQDIKVELPAVNIPVESTLVLYVADDGSTYYALDTADGTTDMSSGECDSAGSGCPAYTPELAYDASNLGAAGNTVASISPLLVREKAIDPTDGINGGVVSDIPAVGFIAVYGIQSRSPYWGWDQLNNATDFRIGYHDGNTLMIQDPSFLVSSSPFMVGHIRSGGTYEPNPANLISTPDSWLLLYIENLGTSSFSLTPYPSVDVTEQGIVNPVSLPAESIPAGEALPLYVDRDGASYYAFEDGGVHTLDLISNLCDGTTACPVMDPVTSMNDYPAAP